ncbi:hypothetical protein [Peribacillus frigoritolerans]|uniref:hypothetical protein n=1 Tax=Peribacillus frigoritolerans TaxID=450367 RepID=UPI001FCF91CB|nr:hypothetical protein [Peribacillus frigoritolerans]
MKRLQPYSNPFQKVMRSTTQTRGQTCFPNYVSEDQSLSMEQDFVVDVVNHKYDFKLS